ncbi:MAG: GNAT family N-acetyltransferase [Candidatus Zixiibacteriota bacterium]|nr:MAG: GNAT family N-acetyltransferase [candidate division Zixibacteria bacterium]
MNVIINGKTVYLRKPTVDELSFIEWLWSDEKSMKEVGGPIIMPKEKLLSWYEKMVNPGSEKDFYCLVFTNDNIPIGEISCHNIDRKEKTARLNFKIAHKYRGKGYAKEIMILFLNHYFTDLNGEIITDDLAEDNIASHRLFKRFGFEHKPGQGEAFYVELKKKTFFDLYESEIENLLT